jgi:ribosomal protein S24E
MKVEIIEKAENPLFKRTEVKFKTDHAGGPTPKRLDVRAQLATQLGVAEELVVIEKLASTHGHQVASGIARAYSSREQLEGFEPKFLLQRGLPKESKPEVDKPPEKPEKPKAEKPHEKIEKPKQEKPPEKPKEEKAEVKEKPSKGGV